MASYMYQCAKGINGILYVFPFENWNWGLLPAFLKWDREMRRSEWLYNLFNRKQGIYFPWSATVLKGPCWILAYMNIIVYQKKLGVSSGFYWS